MTRRPEGQARLLLANVDQIRGYLAEGAVVVIHNGRVRVRRQPVEEDQ